MTDIRFYALDEKGNRYDFTSSKNDNSIVFKLDHMLFSDAEILTVHCDTFNAKAGDDGYYLFSHGRRAKGSPITYFKQRNDSELVIEDASTSHFTVKKADATYLTMFDRVYRFACAGDCKDNNYRIYLKFDFNIQPATDDIELCVYTFPAGSDYNCVAKFIRELKLKNGEIRPLAEKCAERDALEYMRGAATIRIRMGWKPMPSPVPHQTVENEPHMHVACTFARVREIADELKKQGVKKANLCLVGWNIKGHDGRWPQAFPVEEDLGGEEELKKTVAHVQNLGYMITCHTNSSDCYEIADCFDKNELSYLKDGITPTGGHGRGWSGGLAFHQCLPYQLKTAQKILPRVRDIGFCGIHYVDVITIESPRPCFSPAHPCSMKEAMDHNLKIMRLASDIFGGFSSEGCMEYTLGVLDYSLYGYFDREVESEMFDTFIPMWELIYHGITLYNYSSTTVNYTIKGAKERIDAILFGGSPTFYYYSKFVDTTGANWMGETDLLANDEKQLRESVAAIKRACDEFDEYRQLIFMKSFERLDNGLCVVTYEDGTIVIGNYSDKDTVYNGITIPALDVKIIK
jgi:hypothetical protein